MATATALSIQQLEAELQQELQRFEAVQKKLDQDNQKLQAAKDQRAHFVAAIRDGRASDSDVVKAEAEIHRIEILIESQGNASILAKHRAHIDELRTEINRRQDVAAKAAREKEFADLKEHGAALAKKIQDLLVQLCTEDLPAFDAVRRRLAFEFADLDGYATAVSLAELLIKHPGPSEKLRSPEVHLARLEASGFEYESPFQRSPAEPKQFPLQLTVFPMLPMPKQ